jgi:hypothetical protein
MLSKAGTYVIICVKSVCCLSREHHAIRGSCCGLKHQHRNIRLPGRCASLRLEEMRKYEETLNACADPMIRHSLI